MKTGNPPSGGPLENNPGSALQELVGMFQRRGWLNQTLRIQHRGRRYRIVCSESHFSAYRINDHCGVSPGFPGWTVCIVTTDRVTEEAGMDPLDATELRVGDWLRCIAEGDYELL